MTPPVYPCLIVFLENIEGEVAPLAGATAPGKCFQFMLRQTSQVSRFHRETPGFQQNLPVSRSAIKRRFFTESRIVRSKPIRSHGLKHAFTRWRRASFEESF